MDATKRIMECLANGATCYATWLPSGEMCVVCYWLATDRTPFDIADGRDVETLTINGVEHKALYILEG